MLLKESAVSCSCEQNVLKSAGRQHGKSFNKRQVDIFQLWDQLKPFPLVVL